MAERDVAGVVTSALQALVGEAVSGAVRGARASAVHPAAVDGAAANLYLFQLGINRSGAREPLGIRITDALPSSPPQQLDLLYLLSGHGDAQSMEAQQCLWAGVQALGRHEVLSAAEVLAQAGRGEEAAGFGQVSVKLERFDLDQLCNLWVALQARLAPSVIYRVSVEVFSSEESRPA